MRRAILPLLLAILCVTPALAGDKKKKAESSAIQVLVLREGDFQQLLQPPPAIDPGQALAPPQAVVPPAPVESEGTPFVNCSDASGKRKKGADVCPPRLASHVFPKLEEPRPALDCFGCSTFRCEWRFLFGSCRAYFNEGPYAPRFPENCPCGRLP